MSEHMYVHVPAGLRALLEEDGFDEVEAGVSYGEGALDVSANLVGVYPAREQIADSVRRTAALPGPRTGEAGPPVFTGTAGPPGSAVRMEISCPPGHDGTPARDPAAFAGTIVSVLAAVRAPAASDAAG
ncbi:hypothetical protein ACIQK6_25740 [Streptomyces sp. NPDC091682]|uniref:hypothetical protein n=1 Tax=Streptomyces sp. NPDC091682 TaxID=3366005 RepID=UPI0037FD020C